jgi:hypothetical protein
LVPHWERNVLRIVDNTRKVTHGPPRKT